MTGALLCPGPGPVESAFVLFMLVAGPLLAGVVVGTAVGEVVKAVKPKRLR